MSPMFSNFNSFTDWHVQQVGYNIDGYAIDKDILFSGNKLYSENTCVLVPHALNNFLVTSKSRKGECPQGVAFYKLNCKFGAQININGKRIHLGLYPTAIEAFAVYKKAKEDEAKRWASRFKAGEFVIDQRVITSLLAWSLQVE